MTTVNDVLRLEKEILKLPQVETLTQHEFCNGVYARTLVIPAGTVATGAIHKDESFFLIRSGKVVMTTDGGMAVLPVGYTAVTKPLTKRACLALTDVVMTTFHANPTNEKNPDVIWDMYTVPEHEALELIEKKLIEEAEA